MATEEELRKALAAHVRAAIKYTDLLEQRGRKLPTTKRALTAIYLSLTVKNVSRREEAA